jgi:hypothetical protein
MVVGGSDHFNGEQFEVRKAAAADANVVRGDKYEADRCVMFSLTVILTMREVHVEVPSAVPSSGKGCHCDSARIPRQFRWNEHAYGDM